MLREFGKIIVGKIPMVKRSDERTSHGFELGYLFISKSDEYNGSLQSSLLFIKPPVPTPWLFGETSQRADGGSKNSGFPQDLDYPVSMEPRSLCTEELKENSNHIVRGHSSW